MNSTSFLDTSIILSLFRIYVIRERKWPSIYAVTVPDFPEAGEGSLKGVNSLMKSSLEIAPFRLQSIL